MRLPLLIASLLLLAACGGDAESDVAATAATAASGLGDTECRLLVERHRDYAVAAAAPGQEEAMRQFVERGLVTMVEECVAGGMFDREAYDCVVAAPQGSPESHACITDAHARG